MEQGKPSRMKLENKAEKYIVIDTPSQMLFWRAGEILLEYSTYSCY